MGQIDDDEDDPYLSVDDLAIDNAGNTLYFNIQGYPVSHPEKGQLLIKKVNGKTSKIIF